MKYLIKDHTLWNSWVTRLEALIEQYDDVDINRMGFKEKWSTLLKQFKAPIFGAFSFAYKYNMGGLP